MKREIIIPILLIIGGIYLVTYSLTGFEWYDKANAIVGGVMIFIGCMYALSVSIESHFTDE